MRTWQQRLLAGSVAAGISVVTAACASSAGSPAASAGGANPSLVLGLGSDPTTLMGVAAVDEGFLKKAGVDASYKLFQNATDSMDANIAGDVQASGTQNDIQVFAAREKGADLKAFALVDVMTHQVGLVADKNITSVEDLRGKSVGVTFGAAAQTFQALLFNRLGIPQTGAVNLVNLAPPDEVTALASGSVQAIFTFQPGIQQAEQLVSGAHVLAWSGDNGVYTQHVVMTAMSSWLQSNKVQAAKLYSALCQATNWINKNKAAAIKLATKVYHLSQTNATTIVNSQNYVCQPPSTAKNSWLHVADFLHTHSLPKVPPLPNVNAIINGAFDDQPAQSTSK